MLIERFLYILHCSLKRSAQSAIGPAGQSLINPDRGSQIRTKEWLLTEMPPFLGLEQIFF